MNDKTYSSQKPVLRNYLTAQLSPGKVDEKATQLHAIASLKVLLEATRPTAGGAGATAARHSAAATQAKETPLDLPNGGLADVQLDAIEEVSCC